MKKCTHCKLEKPFSDYYRHNQSADKHFSKCKECTKEGVRSNRKRKIDYYREADRQRSYKYKSARAKYLESYREQYPNKYKAHNMVNNAVRDKKLFPQPCEICGNKAHAHHDDYAKPLNVRWLCAVHHKEWHTINGEAKNP